MCQSDFLGTRRRIGLAAEQSIYGLNVNATLFLAKDITIKPGDLLGQPVTVWLALSNDQDRFWLVYNHAKSDRQPNDPQNRRSLR